MLTPASRIAIIGFGAGPARLAARLAPRGCAIRVHDARLAQAAQAGALRARIEAAGLDACATAGEALQGARLVVCDGAPQALAVSALLQPGQTVLAFAGAGAVAGVRARFEGSTLALQGERAAALAQALHELGVDARAVSRLPDAVSTDEATDASMAAGASAPDAPPPRVPRAELP